jgi:hypothetical protein
MTRIPRVAIGGVLFLLFVPCCVSTAAAQSYKVEKAALAPPQELSPAVRDALGGEALRVTGPNGVLCEVWLRKAVPTKASATQALGVTFGQLDEGTMVGAIRIPAEVRDYRRQRIKPGVYTLRYALVPADANHMGVSPQRDFLLASPAAADQDPATVSREDTLKLSRQTLRTNHPSVWSLGPSQSDAASLPAITHQEDGDLWVLSFSVPGSGGALGMGLVVVGSAPEA